jgi:hypothetical protein
MSVRSHSRWRRLLMVCAVLVPLMVLGWFFAPGLLFVGAIGVPVAFAVVLLSQDTDVLVYGPGHQYRQPPVDPRR